VLVGMLRESGNASRRVSSGSRSLVRCSGSWRAAGHSIGRLPPFLVVRRRDRRRAQRAKAWPCFSSRDPTGAVASWPRSIPEIRRPGSCASSWSSTRPTGSCPRTSSRRSRLAIAAAAASRYPPVDRRTDSKGSHWTFRTSTMSRPAGRHRGTAAPRS